MMSPLFITEMNLTENFFFNFFVISIKSFMGLKFATLECNEIKKIIHCTSNLN